MSKGACAACFRAFKHNPTIEACYYSSLMAILPGHAQGAGVFPSSCDDVPGPTMPCCLCSGRCAPPRYSLRHMMILRPHASQPSQERSMVSRRVRWSASRVIGGVGG